MIVKWRVLLIVCIILFLFVSCKQRPRSLVVKKVLIDLPAIEHELISLPPRQDLREITLQALRVQSQIRFSERDKKGALLRVRLDYNPSESLEDLAIAPLMVSLRLQGEEGGKPFVIQASNAVDAKHTKSMQDGIRIALQKALGQIVSNYGSQGESTRLLLDYLNKFVEGRHVEDAKVLMAMQALAVRHEKKATKPLCDALLKQKAPFDAAALSALTVMADPEAVEAVIAYAEKKPPHVRRQAILALRQMGGESAAEWLFVMSMGYPDPQVRSVAEEALADVQARLRADKKNDMEKSK